MSNTLRSLIFAAGLCLVCSVLLTAASTGLKSRQESNVRTDKQKNLLKTVGLIDPQRKYAPRDITALYTQNIRALWVDRAGQILEQAPAGQESYPIYLYTRDGDIEAYIVPINSKGLWGPIFGYLAIDNDGSTVAGFTVYKHSETPGLGGEIEKSWFQKNFVGKKIVDQAGRLVAIRIAKGAVADRVPATQHSHYVDGISGATLTGSYLSSGLADTLLNYEPISIRFRKNPPQEE